MVKDAVTLIKATILDMSACDTFEEAINYFEEIRHINNLPKNQELFDEISKSQIAILFKLLIDLGEVGFKDNKITGENKE